MAAYTFREIKDEAQNTASKKVDELVSEKLTGDYIDAVVPFGTESLRRHGESAVELEIELKNADVFSFKFGAE